MKLTIDEKEQHYIPPSEREILYTKGCAMLIGLPEILDSPTTDTTLINSEIDSKIADYMNDQEFSDDLKGLALAAIDRISSPRPAAGEWLPKIGRMSWDYEAGCMRENDRGPFVAFSDVAYQVMSQSPTAGCVTEDQYYQIADAQRKCYEQGLKKCELRKRFEEWYEADAMPSESDWFRLDSDGDYHYKSTEDAWHGWKGFTSTIYWHDRAKNLLEAFKDFDEQVKNS